MAGPNLTGKPNTADYLLGRGKVYFSTLTNGLPDDYRDLGNAPEFNVTVEIETVEHTSSREGLRSVDKEVVISQKVSLTLTLDEVNHENLALFFSGSQQKNITNPAIAGFGPTEISDGVVKGRWYEIVDGSGVRAMNISSGTVTVADTGPDGMTAPSSLSLGTDYEVNEKLGMIFILSGASIDEGDHIDITLTANASAGNLDEVKALTQSAVTGALKFESINPADADRVTEYQFHQVSLKAEGDFSLISDEFTQMQLSGTAEKNETADADSPTLTIRNNRTA